MKIADWHPATRILHWANAVLILGLLALGVYMVRWEAWGMYNVHKSFGLIASLLIIARLCFRFIYPRPRQPARSKIKALLIEWAQALILLLCCLIPITGMLYSAASGHGFRLFSIPIFPSNEYSAETGEVVIRNAMLSDMGQWAHSVLGYVLIAVLAGHILAALKHHFIDKDDVLKRLLRGTKRNAS